ncbi:MAG: GNAT family N-acetyltransferase [Candidatus Marsarchaeota archaeon]|jgi:ribosomal protein S18 acetylase RimI-like enzyme|nr:GNAT family N-acetyltransferase [Candidatus Marsarchaeota archaeon]
MPNKTKEKTNQTTKIIIRKYEKKDDYQLIFLFDEFQKFMFSIDPKPPKMSALKPDYAKASLHQALDRIKRSEGVLYVAEANGKMVGFTIALALKPYGEEAAIFKRPQKRGEITDIYIDSEYRGNNIGARLMETAESYLKEIGCKEIIVGVFAPNKNAREFYKRLGYSEASLEFSKDV